MEELKDKMSQLENYIMKNCLWQFNSRAWDRETQNEEIMTKAKQLLCGENVKLETPSDRYYWAEAVCLVDAFKEFYPWINTMEKSDVASLMQALKDRLDYVCITGSLNAELTDVNY